MDFFDEDARPRFVLQSKTSDQPTSGAGAGATLSKPFLFVTLSLSSSLLVFSLFFLHSEPSKSLLLWLSLSHLLGPFAPPSLTAGDIHVGRGPALAAAAVDDAPPLPEKKSKPKPRRSEKPDAPAMAEVETLGERRPASKDNAGDEEVWDEREWTEEETEVLRKQLAKNPAGMPGRWEAIAESFRGRHGVESVIKRAKESGEKRSDDSYSEFLRKRKPADKRLLAQQENGGSDMDESVWSSGEDVALLNALKVFPKDVAMRWEKVAAAVPGKSKAACVKRVAELKKGFRSSKKAAEVVEEGN